MKKIDQQNCKRLQKSPEIWYKIGVRGSIPKVVKDQSNMK